MRVLFAVTTDMRINASRNIRNTSLIKLLKEQGHEVYVLMEKSHKTHDSALSTLLRENAFFCNKSIENQKTVVLKENFINNKSFKVKIALFLEKFLPYDPGVLKIKGIIASSELPNQIEVVISSSDPNSSHVLGEKLKKKYPKARWIQYWGDVMSEDIQHGYLKRRISKIAEYRLIKKADVVVYTNPIVADYMAKLNSKIKEKITWISTPFEVHEYNNTVNQLPLKIGYFGSYSSKNRYINNICQAAISVGVPMVVVGSGDVELPNKIEKRERCPFEELVRYEQECSVVAMVENKYIRLANGDYGCLQVPGKLYHYANSNYQILVACEGDLLEKYYSQYDRYIFCKNDVRDIEAAIKGIVEGKYSSKIHTVKEFTNSGVSEQWKKVLDGREI